MGRVYVWHPFPLPQPRMGSFPTRSQIPAKPAIADILGLCTGLCRLSLHFPRMKDIKHLSMCSLAIWIASAYFSTDLSVSSLICRSSSQTLGKSPSPLHILQVLLRAVARVFTHAMLLADEEKFRFLQSPVRHCLPLQPVPFSPVSELPANLQVVERVSHIFF